MMQLGFSPTFYQFVDTIIEVKIAIRFTRETEFTRTTTNTSFNRSNTNSRRRGGVFGFGGLFGGYSSSKKNSSRVNTRTASVEATYSSKYSYTAEGSSLLRTKLRPVPPPAILQERIQKELEENNDDE